jgi:hypothetical protein
MCTENHVCTYVRTYYARAGMTGMAIDVLPGMAYHGTCTVVPNKLVHVYHGTEYSLPVAS